MKKSVFVFVMFLCVVFFGLGCEVMTDWELNVWVIPSEGGSVSRNPDKHGYNFREKVTLTATPNAGYIFDGWYDGHYSADMISTNETITESIGSDRSGELVARFRHSGTFNLHDSAEWEKALNVIDKSGWLKGIRSDGREVGFGADWDTNTTYTINVLDDIVVSSDSGITFYSKIFKTFNSRTDLTVTLQGNATISGGLSVGNGQTVIMKDLTLKGSVYIDSGTFTMESGTISGRVYVDSGGTFNMGGGTISGNRDNYSAGVSVGGGTFNMDGGTISDNTGYYGGGVYVRNGIFNMNGGRISGNTNDVGGGGVRVDSGGAFTMTGGAIWGNTASNRGGGVYVNGNAIFSKTGGLINGYDGDPVNGNKAVCINDEYYDCGYGHAVFVDRVRYEVVVDGITHVTYGSNPVKRKETSAVRYMDLYYNGVTGEFSGAWDY